MVNPIQHAQSQGQAHRVRVRIAIEAADFSARVYDHGPGFAIERVPPPNPVESRGQGLGIHLMRTLMDEVSYTLAEAGNVLEMHKRLGAPHGT